MLNAKTKLQLPSETQKPYSKTKAFLMDLPIELNSSDTQTSQKYSSTQQTKSPDDWGTIAASLHVDSSVQRSASNWQDECVVGSF